MNGSGPSPATARRPARHALRGRPRWVALAAIGCVLGLAATACSGGGGGGTSSRPHAGSGASKTPPADQAGLSITPASGSANVNPAQGITVTAAQGKIGGVTSYCK